MQQKELPPRGGASWYGFWVKTMGMATFLGGAAQASLCEKALDHHAMALPPFLPEAIAKMESGLRPWCVQAQGKAYCPATKEAALEHIYTLQKKGIRNIDVGCMQINLGIHGHHFDSVDQALDPHRNVGYAVQYLKKMQPGDGPVNHLLWGNYHSKTPALRAQYLKKLLGIWRDLLRKNLDKEATSSSETLEKHHFYPVFQATSRLRSVDIFKGTTQIPQEIYSLKKSPRGCAQAPFP